MDERHDEPASPSDPKDWVDRYGDYLYRYALLRLRDPARAEDIVQETFLSALGSRKNFRKLSSEKTWLVGILKHKIADDSRKTRRSRSEDNLEPMDDVADQAFDEKGKWKVGPLRWNALPDILLEQREFWEVFRRCLSDLPSRLADAFHLREMEQLSSREICKVLEISSTNFLVRMHRARRFLRDCLERNWFGDGAA